MQDGDKRLKLGAWTVFAAGAIPFVVGVLSVYFNRMSYLRPDAPFRAILPPGAEASFTLNEVRQFNEQLGRELTTSKHVHYSILVAVGVLIMTLSLFGLRQRMKWSWWVLLVTIVLVGWKDAVTSLAFGHIPVPLVPAILASVRLALAWKPIFSNVVFK
jgi:hypothetical protein